MRISWNRRTVAAAALALAFAVFAPRTAEAQEWTDALSREMTLLNDPRAFDAPPADSLSREMTILNDPRVFDAAPTDSLSREWTLLNDPRTFDAAPPDALSREWTLLNDPRAFDAVLEVAVSREWTLLNDPRAFDALIPDALSREVTIRAGADPLGAVRRALSIAAGLQRATATDMADLNVVTDGNSATRIDTRDAARLMRRSAGLDP